jgi:uncharacterized membrane protein YjgN (DUF898 family)
VANYNNESAFRFVGDWREYAGIAVTNLLLTVVTLGLYRFWATARERRYLWSRTEFIDDALEWTGNGRELFIGFLVVAVIFAIPLAVLLMIVQGVLFYEDRQVAFIVSGFILLFILFVAGLAQIRGLRYRLSRTCWHGIHGGSDDQGVRYATTSFWKSLLGYLPLGLMVPWATVTLMRQRWNAMSFGQHRFEATPRWVRLISPYLVIYVLPLVLIGIPMMFIASIYARGMFISWYDQTNQTVIFLYSIIVVIALVFIWPFAALYYFGSLTRELCDNLSIGGLSFQFDAWSRHWVGLYIGNVLLSVVGYLVILVPLGLLTADAGFRSVLTSSLLAIVGVGFAFAIARGLTGAAIRYRRWRFFVDHLEAFGDADIDGLRRSRTKSVVQGEGLLDALEMGAI